MLLAWQNYNTVLAHQFTTRLNQFDHQLRLDAESSLKAKVLTTAISLIRFIMTRIFTYSFLKRDHSK